MVRFLRSQRPPPMMSIVRTRLPLGVCLLALVTAVWPQQQSTQQTQPVRPVHVVRMTVSPKGLKPGGLTPQAPAALLDYYGGPVVSNLQVVIVFWGSGVDSVVADGIGGFFQNVTDSSYFDLLSEYATTIAPLGGGTGTNQSIGRGTYGGSYTITPSVCNVNPCTVTDTQIQDEMISQIEAAQLPTPVLDGNGNVNTLYMIYFPPGVTIDLDDQYFSCQQFCAYHATTVSQFNSKNLAYGVMPDFGSTSLCNSGCGMGSEFQNVTMVSSHEIAETVTDIDVVLAPGDGPPLAWYDPTALGGGEIGDLCLAQPASVTTPGGVYTVQQLWSNQKNACVSVGLHPSFQLTAPGNAMPGTSFGFTVTVENPAGGSTDTSFAGTVHFTSSDTLALLPADFTLAPSDQGTQGFGATLNTPGAQTIVATDTVNGSVVGKATVMVSGPLAFPPTLPFGNRASGTSFTKKATLTNHGGTVSIASIGITGSNPGDFAETNTCGSTLAVSKSCTVSVTFTPGSLGARSASLVIADGATNSPQQVALTGTGIVQVSVTPAAVTFPWTTLGTTSAAKVIKVKNNQNALLTFSGTPFTFTGTDPGDFAQAATTCGSTLAAGATCTLSITFTPTAKGVRTAALSVADSASPSPQTMNLSGTGR